MAALKSQVQLSSSLLPTAEKTGFPPGACPKGNFCCFFFLLSHWYLSLLPDRVHLPVVL